MEGQNHIWTAEEEEALCAGVDKHGLGSWNAILADPQFASFFTNCSNADLKDKWCKLCGIINGSSSRKTRRLKVVTRNPFLTNLKRSSVRPLTAVPVSDHGDVSGLFRSSVDRETAPEYEALICEAISSMNDPDGTHIYRIINFIEQRYNYALPPNYRRSVTSKLRRLVFRGDLEKVGNRYKIKGSSSSAAETSRQEDVRTNSNVNNSNVERSVSIKTLDDAARYAAYGVAVVENLENKANKARIEADRLGASLKEAMVALKRVEKIQQQCSKEIRVVLAP